MILQPGSFKLVALAGAKETGQASPLVLLSWVLCVAHMECLMAGMAAMAEVMVATVVMVHHMAGLMVATDLHMAWDTTPVDHCTK